MDPHRFLTQAQRLAASTEEEDWRTAASRSYFAAFHVASDFMTSLGFTVPHADRAHGYLWMRLQNSGEPAVAQAGRKLSDLRQKRNQADYQLKRGFIQARAVGTVQDATTIIQVLEGIAEPIRTQVRDAMKDYERLVLQDVTWHP